MATSEARLQERAARLAIRPVPGTSRTWQVESASEPGLWHTVRGHAGETFDQVTCSCQGSRGRCTHRVALARHLVIEVPPPPAPRRPRTETATMPDDHGDTHDGPGIHGRTVTWTGAITDRDTAVQASGKLEGGGRVTLDIPDGGHLAEIVGALTAMRRTPLKITIEPVNGAQ